MDVFQLRDRLITDYSNYITSFITIKDERIKAKVDEELTRGAFWPDPLIQLNPAFEPGSWIEDLVKEGILNPECSKIFRKKEKPDDPGKPLRLHKHQEDAIRTSKTGANYVLTTGTGSGKSLAYIIPIVNYILENGSGKGIKAIIVYPMNALANSQLGELEKFLCHGYPKGKNPVTFERYTGQEDDQKRQEIIANPPDILLTNYVMLELVLTRVYESGLIRAAHDLRFLVFDELHTYRGRQGADIAMLIRRTRDRLSADDLQCVGTSATIAGTGSLREQKTEVAEVASKLFGAEVKPEHVIGETLRRATPLLDCSIEEHRQRLISRIRTSESEAPKAYREFVQDPLSVWLESTFGISVEPESGRYIRTVPRTITGEEGAAKELSRLTDLPEEQCIRAIKMGLLAGYTCDHNPETGFPAFAFRLHQFLSRGDTVYSSVEDENSRYITLNPQKYVPGDRDKVLLPLVFCRECGQEYYAVRRIDDRINRKTVFRPRELQDRFDDDEGKAGFLYISTRNPWPDDISQMTERLPDEWLEADEESLHVRKDRHKHIPQKTSISTDGLEDEQGIEAEFISCPFRFCLNCGVSYDFRQSDDFGKLSTVGTGGRSTATSILSLSTILNLKNEESLTPKARKLLSFTDNRQDASLQAGHFNDFIEMRLLRSALYQAAKNSEPDGLTAETLTQKAFEALNLPLPAYTHSIDAKYQILNNIQKAFKNVLGYRLYRDLKRGFRITSPNLEQCGLLEIHYLSVDEICMDLDEWTNSHPALAEADMVTRRKVVYTLLDFMRRELAIDVEYLNSAFQDSLRQQSNQWLIYPWALDENETPESAAILFPRSQRRKDYKGNVFLSPRSGFGQYLRRSTTFSNYRLKLTMQETGAIIRDILIVLNRCGILKTIIEPKEKDDVAGYQLNASVILWRAGKGIKAYHDPIRVPFIPEEAGRPNSYFKDYYAEVARHTLGFEAREHTAQVHHQDRQEREDRFREGSLPILYCSPTMELGVDISELNVVNLRNIPPNPANYAQRSGRAGRSGQPALVFSYCTIGSPHDQYFFKRPEAMVAGIVTPPRIDMTNEDLVRSHVHAIWLAESKLDLKQSLKDILDLSGDDPSLKFLDSVHSAVNDSRYKEVAAARAKRVLESIKGELAHADWYSEGWVDEVMGQISLSFDQACERWRGLYRAALNQARAQTKIIHDASRPASDKDLAIHLRREAEDQLRLLTESQDLIQSDFYSYRYFASEGFLPGYNFPRLPLSAYIPSIKRKRENEYLSRPRFLAISEFGPRTLIYHEGARYVVNKVMLPVDDEDILTHKAKLCSSCGYLHPGIGDSNIDVCERCGKVLPQPLSPLFRMQNVVTRKRERINSDEEFRVRMGYDLITAMRFADFGGTKSYRTVTLKDGDRKIADLHYGHAATIWRINLGWRRRQEKNLYGFILDIERGYWGRNEQMEEEEQDPLSKRLKRVIPYVEDRKNCILFEPAESLDIAVMASLEAAIENAILAKYQLEDIELNSEPLPGADKIRQILFYESAEGGAGVLRRIIEETGAINAIARVALEICHFNPDTGEDLRRSPRAKEDCEAACYDCLLSYYNQPVHDLVDRKLIKDYLLMLTRVQVESSPTGLPRAEHLERLKRLSGSGLERNWLDFLQANNLHLPTHAQKLIESCKTRPDFYYEDYQAAVYIDGPPHEFEDRHKRDVEQTECMNNLGYMVIRFTHNDNWAGIIAKYPNIFGKMK